MANEKDSTKKIDFSKYPKYLETREDYEFIRNNYPREIWENDFRKLLTDSFVDVPVGTVTLVEIQDEEKPDEVNYQITKRIDFDINTEEGKKKWLSLVKHLEKVQNSDFEEEYDDEDDVKNKPKIEDVYGVKNRDEYLNGNELLYRYIDEDGLLTYYIYRNIERQNSKIRKLGYTPEQVIDWVIGVDEKEAELEEFKKETQEEAIRMLMESTGLSREEAIAELNKNDDEEVENDDKPGNV